MRPFSPNGSVWHELGGVYYYGLFWQGMPDLNFRTPAVREQMIAAARFWLARGLSGFRLDAARYLIESGGGSGQADTEETHAFWREFTAATAEESPDVLLVGEIWTFD